MSEMINENSYYFAFAVLKQLLDQLGERERDIILRRYFENQTQTQIAEQLHISQVQVSRLEKKIPLDLPGDHWHCVSGKPDLIVQIELVNGL